VYLERAHPTFLTTLVVLVYFLTALGNWHEFGCRDDTNAWRKSTKEADKHNFFFINLESKNLSIHLRHWSTNSRKSFSDRLNFFLVASDSSSLIEILKIFRQFFKCTVQEQRWKQIFPKFLIEFWMAYKPPWE